jgi:formyl-CoA transferase
VLSTLEQAEVPVAKIYTAADIHADPHFRHRGMIEPVVLPDGVAVDLPGIVPRLSETPGRTAWIGPPIGAHAEEVLGQLGLDGPAVEGLRKEGVI